MAKMDISSMMKQAQELQKRMAEAQKKIETVEVTGVSGGGLASVTLTGGGSMKKVSLSESLLQEGEIGVIEDLIVAAYNDAKAKMEAKREEEMGAVTRGMGVPPGFSL